MSKPPDSRNAILAGLEVWKPAEGLHLRDDSTLEAEPAEGLPPRGESTLEVESSAKTDQPVRRAISRPSVLLSVALVGVLFLGIIAAVFAGILAKRGSNCDNSISPAPQLTSYPISTCPKSTCPTSACPTSSSQPPPQSPLPSPSSNCSALHRDSYVPSTGLSAFQIRCSTDHVTDTLDLMAVQVSTFVDCINACASYNLRRSLHANSLCHICLDQSGSDQSQVETARRQLLFEIHGQPDGFVVV